MNSTKGQRCDDELLFAEEPAPPDPRIVSKDCWKILIVDDEEEVHNVTRLAISDIVFEGKEISFISAFSGREAKEIIQAHPDTALVLLDVVMETDYAGLDVARYVRDELGNREVRIVLRTGQPGHAPEKSVIVDYDINDYKAKTELTVQKLFTTVIASLRSFGYISTIESNRKEISGLCGKAEEHAVQLTEMLEERTKRLEVFGKFVPNQFLDILGKESVWDVKLGDQIHGEMTILFSDIRSYTSIAETMTPCEVFNFTNAYHERMSSAVRSNDGFIQQFQGDGTVSVFPNSSDRAVAAAVEIQKRVKEYNASRVSKGRIPLRVGIGLHYGPLMIGVIGDSERWESGVPSDTVNTTARMEGLTKHYGSSIIISQATLDALSTPDCHEIRKLDYVRVKGKEKPIAVYEILTEDGDPQYQQKLASRQQFEDGVNHYVDRKFTEARSLFYQVLAANADDRAAALFVNRCTQYIANPVSDDWDGVFTLQEK